MTISNKLQIGSSETTREILVTQFYLLDYILFGTPQHKPNPNRSFLEWFIGFFEYQGFFFKNFDQKQKHRFALEIINKDVQLLMKIRKDLGFGTVVKQKNDIYWRYSVNDFKNCKRLIWLFNGNLITVKKQKQFQIWLNLFNKRYKTEILFSKTKPDICFKNAWLSGFFEALEGDAGFWIKSKDIVRSLPFTIPLTRTKKNERGKKESTLTRKKKESTLFTFTPKESFLTLKESPLYPNPFGVGVRGRGRGRGWDWGKKRSGGKDYSQSYRLRFYIYQKEYFEYVNKIKELLQIPDDIYQISSNLFSNILETSLLKTHLLLMHYLTKYPFLGKGEILLNRWKKVLGYRIKKYPI